MLAFQLMNCLLTNTPISFSSNTGKVTMLTCHHKSDCQKDLVIAGVLIPGAACTHPLIPPMLSKNHPLSTNQASIDRAKAQDPVFKRQCDEATMNAIRHQIAKFATLTLKLPSLQNSLSTNKHPCPENQTEQKLWHL